MIGWFIIAGAFIAILLVVHFSDSSRSTADARHWKRQRKQRMKARRGRK
jgi:hypothetical protein